MDYIVRKVKRLFTRFEDVENLISLRGALQNLSGTVAKSAKRAPDFERGGEPAEPMMHIHTKSMKIRQDTMGSSLLRMYCLAPSTEPTA